MACIQHTSALYLTRCRRQQRLCAPPRRRRSWDAARSVRRAILDYVLRSPVERLRCAAPPVRHTHTAERACVQAARARAARAHDGLGTQPAARAAAWKGLVGPARPLRSTASPSCDRARRRRARVQQAYDSVATSLQIMRPSITKLHEA
jgi:hypothetical protein